MFILVVLVYKYPWVTEQEARVQEVTYRYLINIHVLKIAYAKSFYSGKIEKYLCGNKMERIL